MDIRFEGEPKRGKSPTTRLYAPTNGASEGRERARTRAGAGERDAGRDGTEEPRVQVSKPEIKPLSRIGLIFCGFVFAGMVVFTLTGYERITRAYADINSLNNEIEQTKLRINELDVQIECAVTIQDAQEVAELYGMQYPEKSQYVRIGDPLPFTGESLAADAADAQDAQPADADDDTSDDAPDDAPPEDTQTPDDGG